MVGRPPGAEDAAVDASRRHVQARFGEVESRLLAAVAARRERDPGAGDPLRLLGVSPPDPLNRNANAVTRGEEYRAIEDAASADQVAGAWLRLRHLQLVFELDEDDLDLLLLAAAPEVSLVAEDCWRFLSDDAADGRATVAGVLALCGLDLTRPEDRDRLLPASPLVRGGLLTVADGSVPFPRRRVTVPDRVVSYLLGSDVAQPRIGELLGVLPPLLSGDPAVVAEALSHGAAVIFLREEAGASGAAVVASACELLGVPVLVLNLAPIEPDDIVEIVRECRLRGAVLAIGSVNDPWAPDPTDALRRLTSSEWPVVAFGGGSWDPAWSDRLPLIIDVPAPDARRRGELFSSLVGEGVDGGTAVARLRADQLVRVADAAWLNARLQDRGPTDADLVAAAQIENGTALDRHALRIRPTVSRDDLVVDDAARRELDELVRRAQLRSRVLEDWGLARLVRRTRGVAALFTGPPGTGKTMAAETIAAELSVDLYVVDLATVVDKYIGETEKNLDRVFTAAEHVNGVVLFDEADALFGKRSEVSSAHDRYANIEVAFLLQRIERFSGIAILTSNLRANVDPAFVRRMDAVVEFRDPDEVQRLKLWSSFLGGKVPLEDDVDLAYCADRFDLSGGHIRNAALSAAFSAAAEDRAVRMADVVHAIAREYALQGRMRHGSDFGPYAELLDTGPR